MLIFTQSDYKQAHVARFFTSEREREKTNNSKMDAFKSKKFLGSGGMAPVYLVEDGDGVKTVVKVAG